VLWDAIPCRLVNVYGH